MGGYFSSNFDYEPIRDPEEDQTTNEKQVINEKNDIMSEYLKNVHTEISEDKEKVLKDLLALF